MRRPQVENAAAGGRGALSPKVSFKIAAGAAAVLGLLLIAIAATRGSAPQDRQPRPQDLAAEFARVGDYLGSAETLRAAWRADPTDALRLEAARAFLIAGAEADAIDLLTAPALGDAEDFTRRHLLAEAALRARRFDEAGRLAAALLAEAPRDGRAKLLEARVAHALGDRDKSRSLVADSIRLGGESLGDAWIFRARIALDADDVDAARSAASRARDQGAAAAEADAVDIEALLREGALDEARAALSAFRAAPHAGDGPLAERLETHFEICAGAPNEAARRLRVIAPLVEAAPHGLFFLSRVATLAADYAQGEAALDEALSDAPDNSVLLAAAHERLIAARRFDEAEELAERLGGLDRNRAALARVAAALGRDDHDAAAAVALATDEFVEPMSADAFVFGRKCAPAAAADGARARAARLVAAIAAAKGDSRAAARAAAQRLEESGDDASFRLAAAEIHLALGDDAAAGAGFEHALARSPDSVRARTGLARIAGRAGAFEKAAELFAAAPPTTAGAAAVSARALVAAGRHAEAARALAPFVADLGADPDDAAAAVRILKAAGEDAAVVAVAQSARRARPDSIETARLLNAAGLVDDSIAAARAGVLAFPQSTDRAELYAIVMMKAGRSGEAAAFMSELSARVGENGALTAARRMLDGSGERAETIAAEDPGEPAARAAYLSGLARASSAEALSQALSRIGERGAAIRLAREACFWTGGGKCA